MLIEYPSPAAPLQTSAPAHNAFSAALETRSTLHNQNIPFRTRHENLVAANSVQPLHEATYRDFFVLKNDRILVNPKLPDLALHEVMTLHNALDVFRTTRKTDPSVDRAITGIAEHLDNLLSTTPKIRINSARRRSSANDNLHPNVSTIDNTQSAPDTVESRLAFFRIHPLIHQEVAGIRHKIDALKEYVATITSANLNRIENRQPDMPRPSGAQPLASLALLTIARNMQDMETIADHPDYVNSTAEYLVKRNMSHLDEEDFTAIRTDNEPDRQALASIISTLDDTALEDDLLDFVSKVDFYREAFKNGFPYF